MNLSNLLSKLEKSQTYQDFHKENPDAFFCAAFLIMNLKQNTSENSLDFRDEKDIFSFKILDNEIVLQKELLIENPNQKPLEKIDEKKIGKLNVDIEDLQKSAEKELKKNKMENKLEEIIAVLQSDSNALVWSLTCMCAGFAIVSIKIDALSGNILKFDKKNLLDFVSVKKPEKK